MDDERFDSLGELDGPRALPEDARARLERAMLAEASDGDPDGAGGDLDGIDAPRRIPPVARRQLTDLMAMPITELLADIDGPRPLPAALRAGLERELVGARAGVPWFARAVGVAAVLILIAASAVTITRIQGGGPDRTDLAHGPFDVIRPERLPHGDAASALEGAEPLDVGPAPPASFTDEGVASTGEGDASTVAHKPPPFSNVGSLHSIGTSEPLAAPNQAVGGHSPAAASAPRAVVGVAPGGGAQDEGFQAYVALLNRSGGVRGRRLQVVDTTARQAQDALVTVNLQDFTLGSTPRGPVLEGIGAPEVVLDEDVFGFASPPERQAHLIADAVFGQDAPGATAVVYHTDEDGFGDRIPQAIADVLGPRGVTVLSVEHRPGSEPVFVPADAAFLSMRAEHATGWLVAARDARYRPARGIAGVYTIADPAMLALLPDGARVASPYAFPSGPERDAMMRETGLPLSAELVHGWVTAKAIAVALWVSEATSPAGMTDALASGLDRWENGFAPAYRVREGTNARAPEAIIYRVESGGFVPETGFLHDPF